jgi:23S rRNA pseudouridine1911/1915/1917 synthase
MPERFYFQIGEDASKKRLDDFLFDEFQTLSKMYLRQCLRQERCQVNGEIVKSSYLLRKSDFVEIEVDANKETAMKPEPIPLEIVFEDKELIVVNKPAGMLVHPTHHQKTGTLLNALAFYLNYKEEENHREEEKRRRGEKEKKNTGSLSSSPTVRAGLIHRLDKPTSGLILIAKTSRSHRILSDHFRRKLIEKKYFALVQGVVKDDAGTVDAPIGRYAEEKLWNIKADGKRAVTNFWVKERFDDKTLLELEPVTGRTNQLRIHLAHIGHPIVGDTAYGGGEFSRLCLHAYKLVFWHPNGGRRLEVEARIKNFI